MTTETLYQSLKPKQKTAVMTDYRTQMRLMIANIHTTLFWIAAASVTLIVALSLSSIVQQADGNISTLIGHPVILELLFAIGAWTMISVASVRINAIAKPERPGHIIAQLGFGLLFVPMVTLGGLNAFHAPLAMWLSPMYLAPLLALGCGGICVLLILIGIMRAIWPPQPEKDDNDVTTLTHAHALSRKIAALSAYIVGITILCSVVVMDRPTTFQTLTNATILIVIAMILHFPRMKLESMQRPQNYWDALPQISIMLGAVFVIERTTRAFLFHSGQFSNFEAIDTVYPRVENLLMLPFIIFGLTGFALSLRHTSHQKPNAAEVFS